MRFFYVCFLFFSIIKWVVNVGVDFICMMNINNRTVPLNYWVYRYVFMYKSGVKMFFGVNEFERCDQETNIEIERVIFLYGSWPAVIFCIYISVFGSNINATFIFIVPGKWKIQWFRLIKVWLFYWPNFQSSPIHMLGFQVFGEEQDACWWLQA